MTTQDTNACSKGDACQPDKHLLAYGNANLRKLTEQARIERLNLLHRLAGPFERREYYLTGAITMDAAKSLTALIDQWCRIDSANPNGNRKIRIIMNSAEGDMVPALAIYDYLRLVRSRGFEVTIEVVGHASYEPALILGAASDGCRIAGPHSFMMLSQIKRQFNANSLEAEHRLRWIVGLQEQYVRLLAAPTGMEASEFAERISGNKTWCLNAKEMKRWGFIDEIIEPRVNEAVSCLVDSPFFNADDSMDLMAQKAETARNAAQAYLLHLDAMAQETVDEEYRVHRLFGPVTTESCTAALQSLRRFHARCESGRGSSMFICSPGGSIVDGIGVVGQMTVMEQSGHPVETIGLGYMASMGGVLLAAGATNCAGAESWVLVHRAAGWFGGTTDEMTEQQDRLNRLQNEECFAILASRKRRWPKNSRKKGIDVKEIKKRCDRGDWWVPARVAQRLGLVDRVF